MKIRKVKSSIMRSHLRNNARNIKHCKSILIKAKQFKKPLDLDNIRFKVSKWLMTVDNNIIRNYSSE